MLHTSAVNEKTTELCAQLQQKDYLKEFYWVDDTS